MLREYNGILIRDAKIEDAARLCGWWNDGDVMAHAGFPNGLGTTVAKIEAQIKRNDRNCVHMILYNGIAIGERKVYTLTIINLKPTEQERGGLLLFSWIEAVAIRTHGAFMI